VSNIVETAAGADCGGRRESSWYHPFHRAAAAG